MSLNVNKLAGQVSVAGVTLSQVLTIMSKVIGFITLVEGLAKELKGSEKFKTVMAMLDTLLEQMNLSEKAEELKREIGPIISLVVQVYNFLKLWPVNPTPVVTVPTPNANVGTPTPQS